LDLSDDHEALSDNRPIVIRVPASMVTGRAAGTGAPTPGLTPMDSDLQNLSKDELVAEVMRLRAGPVFLRGCLKYRESLDRELPDAPRTAAEFRDPC